MWIEWNFKTRCGWKVSAAVWDWHSRLHNFLARIQEKPQIPFKPFWCLYSREDLRVGWKLIINTDKSLRLHVYRLLDRKILSEGWSAIGFEEILSAKSPVSLEAHESRHRLKTLFRFVVCLVALICEKSFWTANWLDKVLPRSNVTAADCEVGNRV